MIAIFLMIVTYLICAGITCIFHQTKLSRLTEEDFPDVDKEIFLRWKQIELRRVRKFLWTSWGAFVLQIGLAYLFVLLSSNLSRGDKGQLETIAMLIQLGFLVGSFCLMIACSFGEGDEQKKLRVEAHVKSFYQPAPPISSSGTAISVEQFAAAIDVIHVLGLKSESKGFMSNTTVTTKSYRATAGLSLYPPNDIFLTSGRGQMNKNVYLSCSHCGEKLASYVDYAVYARIPPGAIRANSALKTKVWKYILTHGLAPYWIFFLWSTMLAVISAGFILQTISPFWVFALLFATADIGMSAILVGLMAVYVDNSIRRRDTLLRIPEIGGRSPLILTHPDISPLICVSGVELESAHSRSHELKMLNSKNKRRNSWGSTSVMIGPPDYGNFGLTNPYIPDVGR